MKRIARAGLGSVLVLIAGSAVAVAKPIAAPAATPLPPMPTALPTQCREVARIPASANTLGPALAARISVANCTAEAAMNHLAIAPDPTSIDALDRAAAPSLALLDGVIRRGDPYWSMIAEDAKRDLYIGMLVRERSSVVGADPVAHAALEPRLARWQDAAARASDQIATLKRTNPRIGNRDAVVGHISSTVATPLRRREAQDATAIASLDHRIARDHLLERAFWASNSRTPLANAWHDQRVAERQRWRRERDLHLTETAVAQGWVR